jgi:hypothetical protein
MAWFHSLDSDTQDAIKLFLGEFKYVKELKDSLDKIKNDTSISEQERDYTNLRKAWRYVKRFERRGENCVERIIEELKKEIPANSVFVDVEKQIETSYEQLIKALSLYSGDFKNKLVFLALQIKIKSSLSDEKALQAELDIKKTIQEIETYANILMTWITDVEKELNVVAAHNLDNKNAEGIVKTKIQDITKEGTAIHLTEISRLNKIWVEGLLWGDAVVLGPVHEYSPGLGHVNYVITLKEISEGSKSIFGYEYAANGFQDKVDKNGRLIKEEFGYWEKSDAIRQISNALNSPKKMSFDEKARIRLFLQKYKDFKDDEVITNKDDKHFLFSLERYDFTWNPSGVRWDVGLIINSNFLVTKNQSYCHNEFAIKNANSREVILGFLLRRAASLLLVKDMMFRLTRKNPQDRVPIYYANGEVAWPK